MNLTCCPCPTLARHTRPYGTMRLLLAAVLLLALHASAAPSHLRGASELSVGEPGDDTSSSSAGSSSSFIDPEEDRRVVSGAASYLLAPKVVIAPASSSARQHPRPQDGETDGEDETDLLLQALSNEEQQKWNELWADDFLGEQEHPEDGEFVNMIGSHLPEGVDLNDYNLTWYDDETGKELSEEDMKQEKHRRKLIAVTSNEYYNAKFVQYERVSRGLGGLGWSYDLIVQAQKWARYMAATGDFQHRSKLATGVASGWKLLEENIAMNTRVTRDGAHKALMNSPGHRANILNNQITKLGIGIARGGDGYYYMCQIFKATWK